MSALSANLSLQDPSVPNCRGPVEGSEQDLPRQQDAGNWRGGLAKAGQPCRDQQHINDGVSSGRQHLPAQEFPQPGHICLQSSETHLSCAPKSFVGSSGGGLGQQPFPTEDEGVQSLILISLCLRQDSFSLLAERCLLPWRDGKVMHFLGPLLVALVAASVMTKGNDPVFG